MDLKIQEPESALIIGTFGRAIWVLDDLLSLREIAANRLKTGITALPINKSVQVKGLFINPPGNIWSGFHTTFEGENKVFQETKIPFYLSEKPKENKKVKADIFDSQKRLINTLQKDHLDKGLNYIPWKLNESSAALSGVLTNNSSRDIPALPGDYTIVLYYDTYKDTTSVRVIPDPRFEIDSKVDLALYSFQKEIDAQIVILVKHLKNIDQKQNWLDNILNQKNKDMLNHQDATVVLLNGMKQQLIELRAKGQIPKPERQVGAWQSFKTSPHSKIQEALNIAAAQTKILSSQNKEVLKQAVLLVADFSKIVTSFMEKDWLLFESEFKKSNTNSEK